MKKLVRTCSLAVIAGWSFALIARGDEEKISLDKVPAAVLKAVKKKFPKADVKDAVKEVEDGTVTFGKLLKNGKAEEKKD